jgi:hypothetical protein
MNINSSLEKERTSRLLAEAEKVEINGRGRYHEWR